MPEPTLSPVNPAPTALLAIAEAAISRGFEEVSLNFGSIGHEFAAPTSWMLHLHRRTSRSVYVLTGEQPEQEQQKLEHLSITCSLVDGVPHAPSAYVGNRPGMSFGAYWSESEILSWIAEETELAPAVDAERAEELARNWPLIQDAYLAGWSVKWELRIADEVLFQRSAERTRTRRGEPDLEIASMLLASTTIEAMNWFYNTTGHPANRSTGAKLSVSASLSTEIGETVREPDANDAVLFLVERENSRDKDDLGMVRTNRAEFERVAHSPAPWFVPVASFDGETEDADGGWTLPAAASDWER